MPVMVEHVLSTIALISRAQCAEIALISRGTRSLNNNQEMNRRSVAKSKLPCAGSASVAYWITRGDLLINAYNCAHSARSVYQNVDAKKTKQQSNNVCWCNFVILLQLIRISISNFNSYIHLLNNISIHIIYLFCNILHVNKIH